MYTFRLTEEIARWAFEINFNNATEWQIAFTNPTAGPWKTIKAPSLNTGAIGEVYRFELEETRPDILLFNDRLKRIIIIEAKDSIDKLVVGEQVEKTIEVVDQLSTLLSRQSHNQFWAGRESYRVVTGLLWGRERTYTPPTIRTVIFRALQRNEETHTPAQRLHPWHRNCSRRPKSKMRDDSEMLLSRCP